MLNEKPAPVTPWRDLLAALWDYRAAGLLVPFIVFWLVLGIAASVARYRECRAHGFSAFYCASLD